MNTNNKKISFGFCKLSKKQNSLPQAAKGEKLELIECLEGSEIKVKNEIKKIEVAPLVIEIKGNANNLLGRIELASLKNKKREVLKEDVDDRPDSELTIDELAARQLIREAKLAATQERNTTKVHELPLHETEIHSSDGKEPSMEDYANVPIGDYGLAMLRGMGWKEGMCIGKNQHKTSKPFEPELRPKGLGLGAQKVVPAISKDVFDSNGKQLVLTNGSFGKIIAGPHKGVLCEVQGLDEESGRVVVKLNRTNEILQLNELFVSPISKEEYISESKVLNNAQYERYKQSETESTQHSGESSSVGKDKYSSYKYENSRSSKNDSDRRKKHESDSKYKNNYEKGYPKGEDRHSKNSKDSYSRSSDSKSSERSRYSSKWERGSERSSKYSEEKKNGRDGYRISKKKSHKKSKYRSSSESSDS